MDTVEENGLEFKKTICIQEGPLNSVVAHY